MTVFIGGTRMIRDYCLVLSGLVLRSRQDGNLGGLWALKRVVRA